MKRLSKFAALFTAITLAFTGCNATNESGSESGAALLQTAEPVPTAEPAERETSAPEAEETIETAKSAEAAPTERSADSEREFMTYTQPDEGHVFVDFDYIENAEGITDPEQAGEWLDRALEFLRNTEEYKAFEEYVRSEEFDAEGFADYVDENGDPAPVFERAFIDDFDNDGTDEAFVLINITVYSYAWFPRSFVIFVGNEAEIVGAHTGIFENSILDYGLCKQLFIQSTGWIGADSHSELFGVNNEKPVMLYDMRGYLKKWYCFLSANGWQSDGCFMYYDTAAKEYREIIGVQLNPEDIFAMDRTGALDDYRKAYDGGDIGIVRLFGGKYYLFEYLMMDTGRVFVYENGAFINLEDCGIRTPHRDLMDKIEDIDYDVAVASMLTPAQARGKAKNGYITYTQPDEGHVFVDFDYIENAEGITDPDQAGEWLNRALEFLRNTEEYKAFEEYVRSEEFDAEGFADYVDENGNPAPIFERAYIDDFDNNGVNEAFVFIDIICNVFNRMAERTLTVFVGDNDAEVVDEFSYIYEYSLLDYGCCKQIIICSSGTMGADSHSDILGIKGVKPSVLYGFRGEYTKFNCFLSSSGWQSDGCFMYYDTAAEEYRAIKGIEQNLKEILDMDTSGKLDIFKEEFDKYGKGAVTATLVGGKYYLLAYGVMDTGTPFIYENGEFIKQSNCPVRTCHDWHRNHIEDVDYDAAVASMLTPAQARGKAENGYITYTQPDEGHVFVDFDYIENAEGITDPEQAGEWLDRALELLRNTEEYKAFEEYVRSEEFDAEGFADYVDESGNPAPAFKRAFIDDFDNNGTDEAFVFITIPMKPDTLDNYFSWEPRTFLLFADYDNAKVLDSYHKIYECSMLDYGLCLQLMVCSRGLVGNDTHSNIFEVVDGKPLKLYELRGGFKKTDCFLTAYSSQGANDFMYYDTAAHAYRAIKGKELDINEVFDMDLTGSLDKYRDKYYAAVLIGGKYYCFNSGYLITSPPNVYENGRFTECDNSVVISTGLIYDIDFIEDIDYDAAVASMLTPAQAALL